MSINWQVIHGNCIEIMRNMEENSIDAVISGLDNWVEVEKYKNRDWLYNELKHKNRTMADIAREFNKDLTTIRYWVKKFGIKYSKEIKYPLMEFECPVCHKKFKKRKGKPSQQVYCSPECAYKGRGLGLTIRHVKKRYNTHPTYVELQCQFCGRTFMVEKTEKDRKYCSRKCFLESHRKRMRGANNPSWINGSSYNKRCYRGGNWEEQRNKCYERDNYTCRICNRKCISRNSLNKENGELLIQCHHIKPYIDESSNELSNLITLCASCHKKVHEGIITEQDLAAKQGGLFDEGGSGVETI